MDRPVALDPAYAAREAGAGKPADRCGPEFISDHLPGALVSLAGPVIDGRFRNVCARHDACYELREQSQAWCDGRMRTEMRAICEAAGSGAPLTGALCRLRAGLYHRMVDNAYGAYSYHGGPGGRIASATRAEAPADEAAICVTVENITPLLQEYVLELRSADGQRISREPARKARSIRSGGSGALCSGTAGSSGWTLDRLGGQLNIRLLADDPDTLSRDFVIVDQRSLDLEALPPD